MAGHQVREPISGMRHFKQAGDLLVRGGGGQRMERHINIQMIFKASVV